MADTGAALYGIMLVLRPDSDRVMLESDNLGLVCAIVQKEGASALIMPLFFNDVEKISRVFNLFICAMFRRVGNEGVQKQFQSAILDEILPMYMYSY